MGVRVLLVKGFKVNAVTRYSDYKKFNVESVALLSESPNPPPTRPRQTPPRPTPPPTKPR